MNEFLSIKDVMANLKVCRATVYKHIKGGDLVAYRIGRLVRITRGDFEAFVRQGRPARARRSS
jgi:excisionase family DNA binding protein